jgi:hypothetical protein
VSVRQSHGAELSARQFWKETAAEYGDDFEQYEWALLDRAAESLSVAEEARKAIRKHGLTYDSLHGSPAERPEVGTHRQATGRYQALIKQLGLGEVDEAPEPGQRRGRSYTSTMRRRAGGTSA